MGQGRAADGRGGVAVTLSFRHEVLHLPLRDPFLIARTDHGGGHAVTTRRRRAPRRPLPGRRRARRGLPGPVLRRDGRDGAGRPAAAPRGGRRARADGGRRARRERRGSTAAIRWNGAAKCAVDIGAARPRRQAHRPAGRTGCSASRPTSRRRTSRSASTSRRWSPSGPSAPAPSRRSRSRSAARPTSRPSRRSARSTTSRSGSMRTPAGRPRRLGSCCRRWSISASS